MSSNIFYGTYTKFACETKQQSSLLLSADCMIGDICSIEFVVENGTTIAWIVNKYGARLVSIDEKTCRRLQEYQVRGFSIKALYAFLAFNDNIKNKPYWGEFAIVAYSNNYTSEFEQFIDGISKLLAKGIRPNLDFNPSTIEKIISSKGLWQPTNKLANLKLDKGVAIVKSKRSNLDNIIEQGRSGNIGCWIVSAFIFAVIALLIFLALSTLFNG